MRRPALYNIPSGRPFARNLVRGVLSIDGDDPARLSRRLILLPTRRACRVVREAFLGETGGRPLLLPRLQPLGEVDDEEMMITGGIIDDGQLPPAIPPVRRLMLLSQLIAAREGGEFHAERHIPLARALARLMDQIYTENLALSDLPRLVDGTDFAAHWQITVDFLSILSVEWPRILAAHHMMDAADRRTRLMGQLADHWQANPPAYPVIAAGSTGSIPATARLLGLIASFDQGAVILPGLDTHMTQDEWDALDDTHPQATLKKFLSQSTYEREDVQPWYGPSDTSDARVRLAGEIMRPASQTGEWQRLDWPNTDIQAALRGVSLIEAASEQEEAEAIALLLRETLETEGKTALVITPDRTLARRVIAAARRWSIALDDSAGRPLFQTEAGRFFLSIADAVAAGLKPSLLLSVLKSPFCEGTFHRHFVAQLETGLLRGPMPPPGPGGLISHWHKKRDDHRERNKPDENLIAALSRLKDIMSPFNSLMQEDAVPLDALLEAHIALAEQLGPEDRLWRGEDGQALSRFLSRLREEAPYMPAVSPASYPGLLRALMTGDTVRPAYGTHPRVAIMGQLEARLFQADRLIIAGLNEGTWPPDISADPFLSRPMKRDFGLPPPERAIGLAAHDFVQGFCAPDVYLTRARTAGGAPTIPARWLARLDTVLHAMGTSLSQLNHTHVRHWIEQISSVSAVEPAQRPAPVPPVDIRPSRLSVTQIGTWLRDPYGIYAKSILKLAKLQPLEQPLDAAGRGTLIHAIIEAFTDATAGKKLPANASALFLDIAKNMMPSHIPDQTDRIILWPRLARLAEWFVQQEADWRTHASPGPCEAYALWTFDVDGQPFTLSGMADRIDTLADGKAAIIDYKSGGAGVYTTGAISSGKQPQLPLEALMVRAGAFEAHGIGKKQTGALSYWIVSGGKKPGQVNTLSESSDIEKIMDTTDAALRTLVRTYRHAETPYYALPVAARTPAYNDYAHLARVQEWIALDDAEEAG